MILYSAFICRGSILVLLDFFLIQKLQILNTVNKHFLLLILHVYPHDIDNTWLLNWPIE